MFIPWNKRYPCFSVVKRGLFHRVNLCNLWTKDLCNPWTVSLSLWGSGAPRREFLYSDDLADAVVFLMNNYDAEDIGEFVNIGTGEDLTIRELAEMIKNIVEFKGKINWNSSKLNGTPQKLLNIDRLHKLGWENKIELEKGIKWDYDWYKK